MKPSRSTRYQKKISYILDCFREINEVMPEPEGIVLKGVFFDLSTAIESAMDMIAMLCKDLGIVPQGDYENIQSLQTRKIISAELAERLANCNGLRNVLVHQYNGIDESRVIQSVPIVEEDLTEFIGVVEEHIAEH